MRGVAVEDDAFANFIAGADLLVTKHFGFRFTYQWGWTQRMKKAFYEGGASEKSQAIKDTYNPNGWTKDMYNPRYDFLSAGILINFDFQKSGSEREPVFDKIRPAYFFFVKRRVLLAVGWLPAMMSMLWQEPALLVLPEQAVELTDYTLPWAKILSEANLILNEVSRKANVNQ